MGMIEKKVESGDCLLGFWEINEDFDTLYSKVKLLESEKELLFSFQNLNRRLEWLSVRALINTMTNEEKSIIYDENRKPYLSDGSYNISISHSKDLSGILLSKKNLIGIDIEVLSEKVKHISKKFINEKEYITTGSQEIYHLYIHWCVKEAIYKLCDKQEINFKYNIFVEPFEPNEEGIVKAKLINRLKTEEFELKYTRYKNYSIVWCCK